MLSAEYYQTKVTLYYIYSMCSRSIVFLYLHIHYTHGGEERTNFDYFKIVVLYLTPLFAAEVK